MYKAARPWNFKYVRGEFEIQCEKGLFIVGTGSSDENNEANAELICRAVNNFDELVEFVEKFSAGYISDSALMPEASRILKKCKGGE